MTDQVLSHYQILERIGFGGMGVVYRARDQRLERDVALKLMHTGILNHESTRKRFCKEAIALAKLNHPNIATVFEFDTLDGVDFLAMEFIPGMSLAEMLRRGPLPWEILLPISTQIATAVTEAHDNGIIHRDLKPGNIMLTAKGQIKVLDFGLAQLIKPLKLETTQRSSEIHAQAGTLAYMAPEVLLGRGADARSDIWSFGILSYELATGRTPFEGRTEFELSSAILNQPCPELPPTLPASMHEILSKCLEKDPAKRYPRFADVLQSLKSIASTREVSIPGTQGKRGLRLIIGSAFLILLALSSPSIVRTFKALSSSGTISQPKQLAVLPALGSADDPQSFALERGLAGTLAARLGRLAAKHRLEVVPASEVIAKGVTNLKEAQQEFGVNVGLEISLRHSGKLLRVDYSLVDAKTHRQIYGDTFTSSDSEAFAIEDKVADSVVKALEIDLEPVERRAFVAHGTELPVSHDYYLQGIGYLQEIQKRENIDSAIVVFKHALEKDPKYALAFSGLGEAYWRRYELDKDTLSVQQAQQSCREALALDESLPEGHACLGLVSNGTGRYEEAVSHYNRTLALEPNNDGAIRGLALAYASLGKKDDAEKTYQAAITARPDYWRGYNSLGAMYASEGRYSQAAEMFSHVVALAPDSFRGYSNLGGVDILLGRFQDAVAALQHSISIRPTLDAYSNLATAFFHLRQYDQAARNYKTALALNDQNYVVWGNLADACYYSGKMRSEAADDYRKALSLAQKNLAVNPRDASVLADIAGYYSMLGNRSGAMSYLNKALSTSAHDDPELLFDAALVHNQFRDTRQALLWLTKALDAGYSPTTVADAPALDNLHSDPEFQKLLKSGTPERK